MQGFLRGFTTGFAFTSALTFLRNIKLLALNPGIAK